MSATSGEQTRSISIHALREEGDKTVAFNWVKQNNFYPRPPRGGRHSSIVDAKAVSEFLSTPSARRATSRSCARRGAPYISIHALREEGDLEGKEMNTNVYDFYPRPPRGGRRSSSPVRLKGDMISIHALREEGDRFQFFQRIRFGAFLSTPSARRATHLNFRCFCLFPISIHALREEGDYIGTAKSAENWNFYPRPPRGGRPGAAQCEGASGCISIHALREEGDTNLRYEDLMYKISIHALREEGDLRQAFQVQKYYISIHALREEGDTNTTAHSKRQRNFYPRPPRGGRHHH